MVAYPEHIFAQNWRELSIAFVHNERNESLLIPFLLLIDVIIAGLMDHLSIPKKQSLIILLASGIYALVVGIAVDYIDTDVAQHTDENHMTAFVVCLVCLAVVRFITLLPKPFRKINPFPVGGTATEGGTSK